MTVRGGSSLCTLIIVSQQYIICHNYYITMKYFVHRNNFINFCGFPCHSTNFFNCFSITPSELFTSVMKYSFLQPQKWLQCIVTHGIRSWELKSISPFGPYCNHTVPIWWRIGSEINLIPPLLIIAAPLWDKLKVFPCRVNLIVDVYLFWCHSKP